ncbi:hypothetical protein N6H18_03525 [Reichenbachiella agarivorans]|uniref:Lipoprotein n=1 Tax=Reichenbachiella agarivorans TaxID=2979464 RepID=A0ABY6CR81_9BACT|nr:hypothetical protein [Reichenbachiella agarivorans]UXP33026.1 hypothetical protein N6H18_03525 [Reichenbachiella agarivorans]
MRTTFYILLTFICLTFSCNEDDNLTASELEAKIERLTTKINGIIDASTGETSEDCRTTYIPGGNGCGPIYVYGVMGIDTLELENLFGELSNSQTELYNLKGGSVCDLEFPAKDSLISGSCKACFGIERNYECF